MKKLALAGAILATSMGAMADNTTHDGIISNLTNVYAGLGGTWGTQDSANAVNALGSLFTYADSVGTGYTPPSVTYSPETGLTVGAGSVGVAFVEADFEAEITGVVNGVGNDLFGAAEIDNLVVAVASNGHLSLRESHPDLGTTSSITGLATEELDLGFALVNDLIDDVASDPLSITQARLDTAAAGANAAFGVVNTAITTIHGISSLNDADQTSAQVDAYKLNAVAGVVTYNGHTYCSYQLYAQGTAEADGDCSN